MLLKFPQPRLLGESETIYPVLETELTEPRTGRVYLMPSGCFQALTEEDDEELAGMGLAIVGNVCKLMREAELTERELEPRLWLRMFRGQRDADRIPLPWPGMPDDNPTLPFRPEALPFESAMFLGDDQEFNKRVDRLTLLARIKEVWMPYLKTQLLRVA